MCLVDEQRRAARNAPMIRRARHLMPAISTAASKVSQLLLISAISYVYLGESANVMLVAYLLISSFVQLSDSGAIAYLLVNGSLASNARAVFRVLLIQTFTVGAGLVAGVACAIVFVGVHEPQLLAVLVALSAVQLADGLSRIVRSVFLIRGEPMSFAVPEFVVAGVRTAVMLAAIFTGDAIWLWLAWIPSLLALGYSWWAVARHFDRASAAVAVPFRSVLLYGVSGSISSLYSQSPVMIASIVLAPAVAAPLAVAYRIAQAAEFVPSTFAQQLLPRIATSLGRSRRRVGMFAALGALVGLAIWLLRDVLAILIVFPAGTEVVLLILILSLPFKFANHFLISLTMAVNILKERTIATTALAITAVVLSFAVCMTAGTSVSVAVLASVVEIALTVCLASLVGLKSTAFRRASLSTPPARDLVS
ncbi:hypothetical protein [Cryobacterium sp. TMB1-7]|uniref:hypothetical protein n=1 Tax=Cryobacterium sp. TMB1-7 TaxID=2555866 RepID=UPI00141B8F2F|nr:hypothetical protein [Cryobacterium sp. TMB1-7]